MFKKILIANRGEIAVRIIQTCREMGIASVALYEAPDHKALHVRCADESVLLDSPGGFNDQAAILRIAQERGADAIHPGYGFLAEEADFIRACTAAGLTYIGPSADVLDMVHDKLAALEYARAKGYRTVECSVECLSELDIPEIIASAETLTYPVVVKSCYGGRGPGERLVRHPAQLEAAVRSALAENHAVFGKTTLFLEKAILPANQIGVQILADRHGNIIHLGEREGSAQFNNRKMLEEAPAPCLTDAQRQEAWQTAVALARLFRLENAATVEFLVDGDGQLYFSEIKARIQTEHPLTEALTGIDLIREQIHIAAGEPLGWTQEAVVLRGHAMLARIHAEDPLFQMRSSPGRVESLRLPTGAQVRVDTYLHVGCDVPSLYSSLIGKVTTWGMDRPQAMARLERALGAFVIGGVPTDVPFIQQIIRMEAFAAGRYDTELVYHHPRRDGVPVTAPDSAAYTRHLAAIAAVLYAARSQTAEQAALPERLRSGWHRSARRLHE